LLVKQQKEQLVSRNNKRKQSLENDLPSIPDKRYFSISEVSTLCAVKAYVLRYWEQEFSQLKPIKRQGNRRYYQQHDVLLVRQIKKLLYEDGFTIEGARAQLTSTPEPVSQVVQADTTVKKVIADLESVLQNLQSDLITNH
jgi:DNA-binding transcriptional MerR regulator